MAQASYHQTKKAEQTRVTNEGVSDHEEQQIKQGRDADGQVTQREIRRRKSVGVQRRALDR